MPKYPVKFADRTPLTRVPCGSSEPAGLRRHFPHLGHASLRAQSSPDLRDIRAFLQDIRGFALFGFSSPTLLFLAKFSHFSSISPVRPVFMKCSQIFPGLSTTVIFTSSCTKNIAIFFNSLDVLYHHRAHSPFIGRRRGAKSAFCRADSCIFKDLVSIKKIFFVLACSRWYVLSSIKQVRFFLIKLSFWRAASDFI